jgi:hypothetical protein
MQSRCNLNDPFAKKIRATLALPNSQPPPSEPPPPSSPGLEPELEGPQNTVHVKELGFTAAMPEVVFRKIFSDLSPAFLYHFCRPVCKAWKQHIDRYLIHFLCQKGVIQLIMCDGRLLESRAPANDPNYSVHSTIYCATSSKESYDGTVNPGNQNTIIYKPLGKEYTVNYDWNYPPDAMYRRDWSILDIVSSLFPAHRRDSPSTFYRHQTRQYLEFRDGDRSRDRFRGHRRKSKSEDLPFYFTEVIFYEPLVQRGYMVTEEEVEKFNNLTPSPKNSDPLETYPELIIESDDSELFLYPANSFSNFQFPNPKVFLDICIGDYVLKCRIHTELRCVPPDPQLQYAGWFFPPNWQQKSTLIIDSIEISLHSLLTWNCGCPSKQCPIQNLLSRPVMTTFGPHQHVSYIPGCPTSIPYDYPSHQNVFPCMPRKDGDYWLSKLSKFGDSAASSFVPENALVRQTPCKTVTKPREKCVGCERGIESGKFDLDLRKDSKVVLWASGRCDYGLCGRCCAVESCRGHKPCLNCRWNKAAPPWIFFRKECLKIFGGEICKVAKIYQKKIDDDEMDIDG